jgi:hypothetical protein
MIRRAEATQGKLFDGGIGGRDAPALLSADDLRSATACHLSVSRASHHVGNFAKQYCACSVVEGAISIRRIFSRWIRYGSIREPKLNVADTLSQPPDLF